MISRRILVHACLFVTGAVTIALELIAARLMTPYVGGSLYVWTAILSITLLALALGYHLGSRWSLRGEPARLFARFPAVTAMFLCAAVPLYPIVLPTVAFADALVGAFFGSLIVLGPTLVLLSALGPLGIALVATDKGDRGAGEIFAVSTAGSVLGALAAAFLLLPYMAPAVTLIVLAGVLVAVSGAVVLVARDRLTLVALAPAALGAMVLAGASLTVGADRADLGDLTLDHVATVRNAHATVIVADATHARRPGTVRLYLEENQMQSARSDDLPGQPLFYIAIAEAVLRAAVPEGGRILMLGLAGGTLATDLDAAGYEVEAVDVNPDAARIAEDWFGFDRQVVPVTVADARWFLDHCDRRWDAIFFDVFSGVVPPDHLITREVYAAAGRCLAPGGAVVANTIVPPIQNRPTRRLMAAMAEGLGASVAVYQGQDQQSWRHNRVLLARPNAGPAPSPAVESFPVDLFTRTEQRLVPEIVTRADLADTPPLTDARNDYALGVARMAEGLSFLPVPAAWY